jgi:hypothetical protein
MVEFNERHQSWLADQELLYSHRADDFRALGEKTRWLHTVWSAAALVRSESTAPVFRRMALKRLRKLVGEEVYWSGRLPPWIPMSR